MSPRRYIASTRLEPDMPIRDAAFQYAFSRLFIYNILWEDSEVDERFLGLDEQSHVLGVSGAGCGLAAMVSKRPRRIDAVDINAHHLALSALKMRAAQTIPRYSNFYDLLGRGWSAEPERMVRSVAEHLPENMQRYWKQHWRRFRRTVHQEGLTASMIGRLRTLTGIDASWLLQLVPLSVEERLKQVDAWFRPVLERREVRLLLESPLHLMSLGINFAQRDRIVATEGTSMGEFLLAHLKRVATTDLSTNWFAWHAVAGHYDHENHQAVPPFLRRDRWEKSLGAPTEMGFHNKNIFDVLAAGGPRTWSHYTLCDMPDWLPREAQKKLLREIFRTSRDGAIVLYRSVEEDCLVERHGLGDHFLPLAEATREASRLDRSRQYRHVRFYQVAH